MQTVAEMLKEKRPQLYAVTPEATVFEAVEAMCFAHVRAVLVCEDGWPSGIVSQRDVMTRVILAGRDPRASVVRDVMTRDLVCIRIDTRTEDAMSVMAEHHCRHLPVIEGDHVVGMISIRDLVDWTHREQETELRQLMDYVRGAA